MKIPRVGEVWKIKIPGKPAMVKVLGHVHMVSRKSRKCDLNVVRPSISYLRKNKGRYSGITPRGLLLYGTLIEDRKPCPVCGGWPNDYHDGRLKCRNGHTFYRSLPNKRVQPTSDRSKSSKVKRG